MAKGFMFKDIFGIFCEYHSRDKVLEDFDSLEKVVKISKKDLQETCPACQQAIRDGMKNWCRII